MYMYNTMVKYINVSYTISGEKMHEKSSIRI